MTEVNQKIKALVVANEVRCGKAAIKTELADMPRRQAIRRARDIIENPFGYEGSLYVDELLRAIPYVSKGKMGDWMADARIDDGERVRISELSDFQRGRLTMLLHCIARSARLGEAR